MYACSITSDQTIKNKFGAAYQAPKPVPKDCVAGVKLRGLHIEMKRFLAGGIIMSQTASQIFQHKIPCMGQSRDAPTGDTLQSRLCQQLLEQSLTCATILGQPRKVQSVLAGYYSGA